MASPRIPHAWAYLLSPSGSKIGPVCTSRTASTSGETQGNQGPPHSGAPHTATCKQTVGDTAAEWTGQRPLGPWPAHALLQALRQGQPEGNQKGTCWVRIGTKGGSHSAQCRGHRPGEATLSAAGKAPGHTRLPLHAVTSCLFLTVSRAIGSFFVDTYVSFPVQ